MYIWSIKTLADELRNDQLTESKSFKYFFVVATLSTLSWAAAWLFGMGTPLTNVSVGFVFPVICLGVLLRQFRDPASHVPASRIPTPHPASGRISPLPSGLESPVCSYARSAAASS